MRISEIAWIEIPEDPFVYQEGKTRELPTYSIAKYPITNLQCQTFIDDGGYEGKRWWLALEKPEPQESRWPQGNRPCTNVNCYEAVAFTRWLTARLGVAHSSVRLPTEMEWEKAARGEAGLIYPWDDECQSGFASIDESETEEDLWFLEQTTAVGLYP